MAEQVRAAHLRQAIDLASSTTVADALETHHHAVAAKDLSLAKHTARYDGTELRVLGTQLSAEASRTQSPRLFLQAAELFEYIVSNFDATDAYSWEYYGYNLARSGDLNCAPRVLEAYRNAARLWPDNPLYSGRLLGLRGELGENIVPEFVAALDAYIRNSSEDYDIISFFSEAVVKGLMRQRQGDQLAAIFAQRRAVLERFAPRAAALASSSREGGNS
ncbi:MAG: hypothetical protein EON93_10550 [Burkholderiales bacterium]|nr:MAG: hypothetical protein EON93_10550 [Burkholderiales bacterium]